MKTHQQQRMCEEVPGAHLPSSCEYPSPTRASRGSSFWLCWFALAVGNINISFLKVPLWHSPQRSTLWFPTAKKTTISAKRIIERSGEVRRHFTLGPEALIPGRNQHSLQAVVPPYPSHRLHSPRGLRGRQSETEACGECPQKGRQVLETLSPGHCPSGPSSHWSIWFL